MKMTIGEAFAKAGYPVPLPILLYGNYHGGTTCIWNAISHDQRCNFAADTGSSSKPNWWTNLFVLGPGIGGKTGYEDGVNLINLPAIDAYDYLPSVVKSVVDQEERTREEFLCLNIWKNPEDLNNLEYKTIALTKDLGVARKWNMSTPGRFSSSLYSLYVYDSFEELNKDIKEVAIREDQRLEDL